jgi:hypothetical protein
VTPVLYLVHGAIDAYLGTDAATEVIEEVAHEEAGG